MQILCQDEEVSTREVVAVAVSTTLTLQTVNWAIMTPTPVPPDLVPVSAVGFRQTTNQSRTKQVEVVAVSARLVAGLVHSTRRHLPVTTTSLADPMTKQVVAPVSVPDLVALACLTRVASVLVEAVDVVPIENGCKLVQLSCNLDFQVADAVVISLATKRVAVSALVQDAVVAVASLTGTAETTGVA